MSDIIKAIVLGIVEGITEFLPVSSTGHLILVNQFISFSADFTKKFDVIIQLGAILSVVVIFFDKLNPLRKGSGFTKNPVLDIWGKTIIGVIPALFAGALFHKIIEDVLFNPVVVSIALFAGGILLIFTENLRTSRGIDSVAAMNYKTAFFIGIIQCLAMIPGTSRSAATIIGAMLLGCTRIAAVEFSFFLAIPTMFAAAAYSLFKIGWSISRPEVIILAVGFIIAFFTAWIVVKGFLAFITKNNFKPFGYYRIALGIIILLYFIFRYL